MNEDSHTNSFYHPLPPEVLGSQVLQVVGERADGSTSTTDLGLEVLPATGAASSPGLAGAGLALLLGGVLLVVTARVGRRQARHAET